MAQTGKYLHRQKEEELRQCPTVYQRNPKNQTKIGKNVFLKKLTDEYALQKKTQQYLNRSYLRFQKTDDKKVKIGVQGDIKANEEFVACFVKYLVGSSMCGYVFIGIQTPLLNEISKVDYSRLQRLQFIKCQINNIEPLAWLNTNRFKSVYLRDNHITSLKPLIKAKFNNFQSIELDNNPIKQLNEVSRIMMTVYVPEKNNKFFLFMTQDKFQTGNLSFILKTQNTQICVVGQSAKSDKHIKQEKMLETIRRLQRPPVIPQ